MSINAKYPGTCTCCGRRFEAGTKINWTKGAGSSHVDCSSGGEAPKAKPARAAMVRRAWRPCGYPGCNPTHCDECDGEGARGRW